MSETQLDAYVIKLTMTNGHHLHILTENVRVFVNDLTIAEVDSIIAVVSCDQHGTFTGRAAANTRHIINAVPIRKVTTTVPRDLLN